MSDTIQLNYLEQAIWKHKAPLLDNLNTFELWKVNIEPEKVTQTYWIPDHVELNWPLTQLSTVFDAELKDTNVNIILARVSDLILSLNCLIRGDTHNHIFTVKVSATNNVYSLKKEIKRKKDDLFHNYDAASLLLWKVSLPCDNSLEHDIENLDLDTNQLLSPMESLSHVFPTIPATDHVHIIFVAEYEAPW
ncbi:hypothetical protein F4604DRAFT_1923867 [Suillus subluteus]|nr:hypothetical protein F4604DRAFT_1923867 [Suillus subluteus]